jgi:glycosyltransferase involved in cell wall biosynthesis
LLLEAELAAIGEPDPPPLCVVPFGIDDPPAQTRMCPLRERFPEQISPGDRIVLWWGSLWRWLDAESAIRAVASLASTNPEVKLVLTAGQPPNQEMERHSTVSEAKRLAGELGVLDHSVLFLDSWIPFERRGDYLMEADLGLTLHRGTEEAPLAARARYMDYLWAGLPCVLGRGDETAARFEEAGFASLVGAESPTEVARAIVSLLDDSSLREARRAGRRLGEEYRWERTAAPLLDAVRQLRSWKVPPHALHELRRTTAYSARRVIDRVSFG